MSEPFARLRRILRELKRRNVYRVAAGGLYLNFPGMGEEGEELVRSAYGGTYERLAELKVRWDPNNLFRVNQNIEPTA